MNYKKIKILENERTLEKLYQKITEELKIDSFIKPEQDNEMKLKTRKLHICASLAIQKLERDNHLYLLLSILDKYFNYGIGDYLKTLKNDEIEYTDVMRYNPYKDLTINTKTFKEVFGLENFMEYRDKNYVYNKKPIVKIEELEQGYMKISSTEVFNDFVKFICDEFGYKTI